jgi:ribosomal subunit interface protein
VGAEIKLGSKGVPNVDIIFKGRHTEVQERFRSYALAKLGKIEKLDHKAIMVDVEVCAERNPRQSNRRERVELTIRSRGPVIRAEASADDRFAAFDRALAKVEERMRRTGERRIQARRGLPQAGRIPGLDRIPGLRAGRGRRGNGAAAGDAEFEGDSYDAGLGDEDDGRFGEEPDGQSDGVVPIQMEGDGPLVVREKHHPAEPMSVDRALAEMELVGHDFYLFRDSGCGLPSVVYRRHGYQYGLIRLMEQAQARTEVAAGRSVRE